MVHGYRRHWRQILEGTLIGVLLLCVHCSASADTIIDVWGNNSNLSGGDITERFLVNETAGTGSLTQSYVVSPLNGRGVVVVGNTMYTTQNDGGRTAQPDIFVTDVTTGQSLGVIHTPLFQMASLAWDGSHFWTTDYFNGTNRGFQLDLAGNITKTVTFDLVSRFGPDSIEYFNGKLIVNRGSLVGIYDVYDLDGNVISADFFHTDVNPDPFFSPDYVGLAFDGTNFLVSDIFNQRLVMFDGVTGNFIKFIDLPGTTQSGSQRALFDLSVDYLTRADITSNVPDAGSALSLFGLSTIMMAAITAKRWRAS